MIRRSTKTCWLVSLMLLLPFACGCAYLLVGGGAAAGAVYYTGRAKETLDASLEDCHAAGRQTLRDLELPLQVDRADALTARLESRFADEKPVRIDMKKVGESLTEVTVRVGLVAEAGERAMDILSRIKGNL